MRILAASAAIAFFIVDPAYATPVGQVSQYTAVKGDTLASIARANHVGLVELLSANPAITSETISIGQPLTIPGQHLLPDTPRTGIVINLSAMRIYRFAPDGSVATFPISVGKEGWDTPTGQTKIVAKREKPDWTVPDSIRAQNPDLPKVVPAGPDNPLGQYAMTLGWPGYLIHGTNTPWSIGKPSSHGCIRLFPEDIETLYRSAAIDEAVTVIDAPFMIDQTDGVIYLQASPTRAQAKAIAGFEPVPALRATAPEVATLNTKLDELQKQGAVIDRNAVAGAVSRHDGIPVVIGKIASTQAATPGKTRTQATGWSGFWQGIADFFRRIGEMIGLA